MAFRERERVILFTGLAAASLLSLIVVAQIAGASLGATAGKLGFTVLLAYFCLRLWGHATTLAERGVHERLAAVGRLGAPIIFLLLLAQMWHTTTGVRLTFGSLPTPEVQVSTFARLEWSADVVFFGLLLVTAIAVWLE